MIAHGGRGFIEYIPGDFAWRGIHAPNDMVIHCLWVVGKAKSHGCGKALLQVCIDDAKQNGMHGVAVVTARSQLGLPDTKFFQKHGFKVVDNAPPELELATLKFGNAPDPKFLTDWAARCRDDGTGLKVIYTSQCPFAKGLADNLANLTKREKIPCTIRKLNTLKELRNDAPSAYGTFAMVAGARVLLHLYHQMTAARLRSLISGTR